VGIGTRPILVSPVGKGTREKLGPVRCDKGARQKLGQSSGKRNEGQTRESSGKTNHG
jgi:hypothetical protein